MSLINSDFFKVVGWSILHSFWQSLVLLLILRLVLLFWVKTKSNIKYAISFSVLLLQLFCTCLTFYHFYNHYHPKLYSTISGSVSHVSYQKAMAGSSHTYGDYQAETYSDLPFLEGITGYITLGWVIGILFCVFRLSISRFHLQRLRRLPEMPVMAVYNKLYELCINMNIKKVIKLVITDKVCEPFVFGLLKPILLMPLSYISMVPADELELILAHELSHIKRNDYLYNLIQSLIEAIYFFNPFVIAISAIIREEREYCCDDMALSYCGNRKAMALALANLHISATSPRLSLAFHSSSPSLYKRIARLVRPSSSKHVRKASLFSILIILFFVGILSNCTQKTVVNEILTGNQAFDKSDSLIQTLTDNQAGKKITIFSYTKGGLTHEVFLLSTEDGTPSYAYLDGNSMPEDQFRQFVEVLNYRKSIPFVLPSYTEMSSQEKRDLRLATLSDETDSLKQLIEYSKKAGNKSRSNFTLKQMQQQYDTLSREMVSLSMEKYKEDIKTIPADVQLHDVLGRIVRDRKYSVDDQKKVRMLIAQKQSVAQE